MYCCALQTCSKIKTHFESRDNCSTFLINLNVSNFLFFISASLYLDINSLSTIYEVTFINDLHITCSVWLTYFSNIAHTVYIKPNILKNSSLTQSRPGNYVWQNVCPCLDSVTEHNLAGFVHSETLFYLGLELT